MKKIKKNEIISKNINNDKKTLNPHLLNLIKFKLHPPPIGSFLENPELNPRLNFSLLEPVLSKGKKILIGDGSFSKVYLFQNKISKIKYAIKKMNISSFLKKTNNKDLIINEINIQSKINHPNIIRLYNYFEDKNNINIFLVLEYASQKTLFDYIRYKKGLNEIEAFYYFIQAVNAIYFLHKNKIIHRDIKPENLLINNNNILKLCDFGWSVYLNNNKRVTFCGTVEYMAPEIVKKKEYDFSIDVWSLGVLLYELIHSHSPFVAKDLNINKIENNIISKELRFKKGVSLECRDLIEKLLIKDAENRIKIENIYTHPFVLKYVNMINNYINLNYNNTYVMKLEQNKKNNQKEEINGASKNNIRESFSEFDSIPSEPEASKILVNLDNAYRKLSEINKNIDSGEKQNNENKFKNIKNLLDKNVKECSRHKKSLSLNESNLEKLINNKLETNNNENMNKNKLLLKEISENKTKNINKDNLLKLIIKKTKYENPNMRKKKFIRNILIEEYNNNLNKNHHLTKKGVNEYSSQKIKENKSFSKNQLISSYNDKNKKYIVKKKLDNCRNKKINEKSKLNISSKLNSKNYKSISFFNKNNNVLYNDHSAYLNYSSYGNINNNKKEKSKKKKIIINSINSLSKGIKDLFVSKVLKKPLSKESFTNKFAFNLSNINIYNVCSSNFSAINSNLLNDSKSFQQINAFFTENQKNINNNIISKSSRLIKKKKQKLNIMNDKSNNSNSNSDSKRNINKTKNSLIKNQKLFFRNPILNKGAKSCRNIKQKFLNNNSIPLIILNIKK